MHQSETVFLQHTNMHFFPTQCSTLIENCVKVTSCQATLSFVWENIKEINKLGASSAFLYFVEDLGLAHCNGEILYLSYFINICIHGFFVKICEIQANSASLFFFFFPSLLNNYLPSIFQVVIFPMRYLEWIQSFKNPKHWIALSCFPPILREVTLLKQFCF